MLSELFKSTNSPETSLLFSTTFPRLQQLPQVVSRLHGVAVGTVGGEWVVGSAPVDLNQPAVPNQSPRRADVMAKHRETR